MATRTGLLIAVIAYVVVIVTFVIVLVVHG